MMYQKLVKTYSKIATSNDVFEKTIKNLKMDITSKELGTMVETTPQQDTQIMDIKDKSKDHLNFSTGSVVHFLASPYIMRLSRTSE